MSGRRGRGWTGWLALLWLLSAAAEMQAVLDPPALLAAPAASMFDPGLRFEKELTGGAGYRAYLVTYCSAGLRLHAMVAVPETPKPAGGYPVLIANHGYHPDPPRYGIGADGIDRRPGDYYRAVPGAYAQAGFLVVMPDFRGHGSSAGLEYTQSPLATLYYTEDVLALLAGLRSIPEADPGNVFMWGHSMGGEVTLRALLAGADIRGASLWAPVGAPLAEQATHYDRTHPVSPARTVRLEQAIDEFGIDDLAATEPLRRLGALAVPLVIHHARGDPSVPYRWTERLAAALDGHGRNHTLFVYDAEAHMFDGALLRLAVARDTRFFRALMEPGQDEGTSNATHSPRNDGEEIQDSAAEL